jgi:hypothetical protein
VKTAVHGQLVNAYGDNPNGCAVVSWPPFSIYGTSIAGGMQCLEIADGIIAIDLYPTGAAVPPGTYYTVRFELDSGAVYEEYWIVPDTASASLEQIRVAFPVAPGLYISPTQLTGMGAQPGMILSWNGSNWVGGWVNITNVDPNYMRLEVGTEGTDFWIDGSPVMLGNAARFNLPDAGPAARGVVTTGDQSFAGDKTFLDNVLIDGALTGPTIASLDGRLDALETGALSAVPPSRRIIAGTGLTGGGDLSVDRTLAIVSDTTVQRLRVAENGTLAGTRRELNFIAGENVALTVLDSAAANRIDVTIHASASGEAGVPETRRILAGAGLTGGGDLSADRTFAVLADSSLQRLRISQSGAPVSERQEINFIPGSNVTLSVVENAGGNRVDITLNAAATGSQTPWLQDIEGANYRLNNINSLGIGTPAYGTTGNTLLYIMGSRAGQALAGSALQVSVKNLASNGAAGFSAYNDSNLSCGFYITGTSYTPSTRSSTALLLSKVDFACFIGADSTLECMRMVAATGNVLLGVATDDTVNRLQVNGKIRSMSGGYVFPDGTVQATAAVIGSQTPWTTDIDAAGHSLGSVSALGIGGPAQGNSALYISTASTYTSASVRNSASGGFAGFTFSNDLIHSFQMGMAGSQNALIALRDVALLNAKDTDLVFATANAERLRITASLGNTQFAGQVEIPINKCYCGNLYNDGSWRYRAAGSGFVLQPRTDNASVIYTASAGTAGAVAALTPRITMKDDGSTVLNGHVQANGVTRIAGGATVGEHPSLNYSIDGVDRWTFALNFNSLDMAFYRLNASAAPIDTPFVLAGNNGRVTIGAPNGGIVLRTSWMADADVPNGCIFLYVAETPGDPAIWFTARFSTGEIHRFKAPLA